MSFLKQAVGLFEVLRKLQYVSESFPVSYSTHLQEQEPKSAMLKHLRLRWILFRLYDRVSLRDWTFGFEFRMILDSAKVRLVMDIRDCRCLQEGFLQNWDAELKCLNVIQASVDHFVHGSKTRSQCKLFWISFQRAVLERSREESAEATIPSSAIVVSALVLLSLVYQYLAGIVDRGGSKAYSRSSLDFRDVYVAIVLFLGAYVWIKSREAALKGAHPRKLPDKQGGTRVVYEARLSPPLWNGEKLRRLELGRFATREEAHNQFRIAAFYYDSDAGLLDGWFQVPPMTAEERSLAGPEKRAWVIRQARKVYKDFKKKEEEDTALWLENFVLPPLLAGQGTPEPAEGNVGFPSPSLSNVAGQQEQPALAIEVQHSGVDMTVLGNHGLEYASGSFDGVHEGHVLSNFHSLGSPEGSALPVSRVPPNAESGRVLDGSDQLDLLQPNVCTLQQQIFLLEQQNSLLQQQNSMLQQQTSLLQQQQSLLQQQIFLQQQQISLQPQQIQESLARVLQLQQQQQLQGSCTQNPPWPYQFGLQQMEQQQVFNIGVPGFEVEMEQSMHQPSYPGPMAPPPDGGEGTQEAF